MISIVVTWVRTGAPFVVPSAMSKAGVDVMTKSLAIEWGRYGIRLNAIAPGIFPTEGANKRLSPKAAWNDDSVRNPMNRLGRMSELQNLAVFLMADGVEWLTGETIAIDGAGHRQNGASFTELAELSDAQWREMREAIRGQDQRDKSNARLTPWPASVRLVDEIVAQGRGEHPALLLDDGSSAVVPRAVGPHRRERARVRRRRPGPRPARRAGGREQRRHGGGAVRRHPRRRLGGAAERAHVGGRDRRHLQPLRAAARVLRQRVVRRSSGACASAAGAGRAPATLPQGRLQACTGAGTRRPRPMAEPTMWR